MVAFSFDDGPNYSSTSVILDTLEQNGGSATFFIVGNRLKSSGNAECAKRMVSLGCQLGNHTYDHTHYGKQVCSEDIDWNIDAINEATGHKPTAFRPTGGLPILLRKMQKRRFISGALIRLTGSTGIQIGFMMCLQMTCVTAI